MASSLKWLDYDATAYDRSTRMLALLKEPETRDELGIGRIRDALSDQLFPGTSVIQTRLRYMLLLPRMFIDLENSRVAAKDFASRARVEELTLNKRLKLQDGAFGKDSGDALKRLASSVYWAGLRSWGILLRTGSQRDYYAAIDQIRDDRRQKLRYEDGLEDLDSPAPTWHADIPTLLASTALDEGSFALTRKEATFIREQWKLHHPTTLLTWLAQDEARLIECKDAGLPWFHPQLPHAPAPLQALVAHARRFSDLAHGAALLYNLALAEASGNTERNAEYGAALKRWSNNLPTLKLDTWDMPAFWEQVQQGGKPVHTPLRRFVNEWLTLVNAGKADSDRARELIKYREADMKGNLSRFRPENLPRWNGASGVGRLNYRWSITQSHLADLLRGLEAA
ncbi:DUF6361 family protein [uncultured Stenotrophomonas sp.]|uniref:DUF6361 family protein n=1 Tax=uncultured Stenotrophomonas sp. TaxID=165438 RepID=UPI0025CF7C7E|nr:DUF6361 family protein [uncultured Stenotrophomonas sp.]